MYHGFTNNQFHTDQRIRSLYIRARRRAFWGRLLSLFGLGHARAVSYESFRRNLRILWQVDRGIQTIPVKLITGSVDRSHEFDRNFMPLNETSRARWLSMAQAYWDGKALPPVEVIKIGEDHFVIDGNHRISVARTLGQEYIEAHIIETGVQPLAAKDCRNCDELCLPAPIC